MKNKPNNPNAFPYSALSPEGPSVYKDNEGMTLRDYFAAKAMQSIFEETCSYSTIAERSYEMADAMLKEREK
jgi:hypothetical protein